MCTAQQALLQQETSRDSDAHQFCGKKGDGFRTGRLNKQAIFVG